MKQLFKNIESLRKEKGVKQVVIAELMGVKQNTYSQYINRSNDMPYSRLSQIADILNVRVIDIITYPEIYVIQTDKCSECREKDKIIKNLNKYIETLEKLKK